jgi:hypothetical protein
MPDTVARFEDRYPLTRIASQSDLSPQAGRGKKNASC